MFLVELVVALNNAMEQWSYSNCDVIESGALTIAMRNSMNAAPNLDVMHRLMLIMLAISHIISLRESRWVRNPPSDETHHGLIN